jgi:NADH-quinone oxidoreductase subunit C
VTIDEVLERLHAEFGADGIAVEGTGDFESFIVIRASKVVPICEFLRHDSDLYFDALSCLSGVDHSAGDETMEVVYHLQSMRHLHRVVIKTIVPKDAPRLSTVEHLWKIANWHEREVYDLYGVVFDKHSDLRRILLPDDWEGHPMRKDYQEPDIYRGMKVPY